MSSSNWRGALHFQRYLAAALFVPFSLNTMPQGGWPESLLIRIGRESCEAGPIFRARLARNDSERELGLSHRLQPLAADEAMLFVWRSAVSTRFWMKDTLIPLSILFFGENSRAIASYEMPVEPEPSHPVARYPAPQPVVSALELAPGVASRLLVNDRTLLCLDKSSFR